MWCPTYSRKFSTNRHWCLYFSNLWSKHALAIQCQIFLIEKVLKCSVIVRIPVTTLLEYRLLFSWRVQSATDAGTWHFTDLLSAHIAPERHNLAYITELQQKCCWPNFCHDTSYIIDSFWVIWCPSLTSLAFSSLVVYIVNIFSPAIYFHKFNQAFNQEYKKGKLWENKNTDTHLPSDTSESISDPKACVFFMGCHNYWHCFAA